MTDPIRQGEKKSKGISQIRLHFVGTGGIMWVMDSLLGSRLLTGIAFYVIVLGYLKKKIRKTEPCREHLPENEQ